jgi:hypothetical protein
MDENSQDGVVKEVPALDIDAVLKATLEKLAEAKRTAEAMKTIETATIEAQRNSLAALTDVQVKFAEISTIASEAAAAKSKIADAQQVIATKSEHIEDARGHADKIRAQLDRLQTTVTQQATEAEAQKTRAQAAADSAAELLVGVKTSKDAAEKDANMTLETKKSAQDAAAVTKSLAERSQTIEKRIMDYEAELGGLVSRCAEQLRTIESLLPGATSAGLASAFDKRRETFLNPQRQWQWAFVGSVALLVIIGAHGLWHIHQMDTVPTYDELARLWLGRLPVVIALVWLALYSSRETALAKRLEEDYGYKSSIAACFEGFRKQMSEIGKEEDTQSPVGKLCTDTLRTIAAPPGRIYDKHKLTISPTSELAETAKSMKEMVTPKR